VRKTGAAGLELIKGFETLQLRAYLDRRGGVLTIGYGHTEDVKPDDVIIEHQADVLLEHDLADAEECVNLRAPGVNQNQFDALVSLVFNIGCSKFSTSTLLRLVRAGDFRSVSGTPGKQYSDGQFARWNHDDGVVLDGLTRRRKAEAILFATPTADFSDVQSGVESTAPKAAR
jgi:lysozyme